MFIVDCGVYPFDILVYFGSDKKKLFKELSKYLPIKELKKLTFNDGKTIMFSSGQTVLWLKEKPTSIKGIAQLNHEIFHCACFVLERVGIKYCKKTDEAYAYLLEYLTKQIYSKIDITFS